MRALVVAICALVSASTARADRATEAAAQVHLDRGVTAFRAGDFARAHHEFAAAHELAPDKPNPFRWLAFAQVQLGDCAAALANIAQFVTRVAPDDPRLAELGRLRALCARTGALHVTSRPAAVALRIDGALVGTTPFHGLSMRAGRHVVSAERKGYGTASRAVEVPAGGRIAVELALAPASAPRPLVRRPWFWVAVVGAAVTVAGAAVFVLRDGDDPGVLPPIACGPDGCRPGGA